MGQVATFVHDRCRPTGERTRPESMPSLIRFLMTLAVLAALGYAAMFALATFVEPTPREIRDRVPSSKLNP